MMDLNLPARKVSTNKKPQQALKDKILTSIFNSNKKEKKLQKKLKLKKNQK